MALFTTLTKEKREAEGNGPDTRDYEEFKLNDLDNNLVFQGQPYLTKIYENEFEDEKTGKMVKKYSANLYISNHDEKEKIKARVNFKTGDDKFTAWQGSVAYDIIDSLEELNEPGTAGLNNVYTMSFEELQKHINSLESVKVKVVEHRGEFWYNTLKIISVGE